MTDAINETAAPQTAAPETPPTQAPETAAPSSESYDIHEEIAFIEQSRASAAQEVDQPVAATEVAEPAEEVQQQTPEAAAPEAKSTASLDAFLETKKQNAPVLGSEPEPQPTLTPEQILANDPRWAALEALQEGGPDAFLKAVNMLGMKPLDVVAQVIESNEPAQEADPVETLKAEIAEMKKLMSERQEAEAKTQQQREHEAQIKQGAQVLDSYFQADADGRWELLKASYDSDTVARELDTYSRKLAEAGKTSSLEAALDRFEEVTRKQIEEAATRAKSSKAFSHMFSQAASQPAPVEKKPAPLTPDTGASAAAPAADDIDDDVEWVRRMRSS